MAASKSAAAFAIGPGDAHSPDSAGGNYDFRKTSLLSCCCRCCRGQELTSKKGFLLDTPKRFGHRNVAGTVEKYNEINAI